MLIGLAFSITSLSDLGGGGGGEEELHHAICRGMSIHVVITVGQLSKRLAMRTGFASRPGCVIWPVVGYFRSFSSSALLSRRRQLFSKSYDSFYIVAPLNYNILLLT